MSDYVQISSSLGDLMGKGAQIQGHGDTYLSAVNSKIDAINSWEHSPDIGTGDEYYTTFHTSYTKVPPGGDKPGNEMVKNNLREAGNQTSKMGGTVVTAMVSLMGSDMEGAAKIGNSGLKA